MRRSSLLLLPLTLALACGDKDAGDSGVEDADGDGVSASEDCDDDDASVYPGADEACDGVDNNCDGAIDEGVKLTFYEDGDGDGYGDDGVAELGCTPWGAFVEQGGDCDDSDATVNPGADEEECTDPVDRNCDGVVAYEDADGDGEAACVDCDDHHSGINSSAEEVCDNLDNNCDGTIDEGTATDADTFYADADADGFGDAANTTTACFDAPSGYVDDDSDCDDADAAVYPGAPEICDAKDSDCDGTIGETLVPTDYGAIQDAIDAGETDICVEAGTYTENLFLAAVADTRLRGVGSASVVIDGGAADAVLTVQGNGFALDLGGFTVQNGLGSGLGAGLVYVGDGSGDVEIRDVLATGNACSGCDGGAITAAFGGSLRLQDVEVTANDVGVPVLGLVGVYGFESVDVDGVEVHDEELVGSGFSYGAAITVLGSGTAPVASVNDVGVRDLSVDTSGDVYGLVTLGYLDDVQVTNVDVESNEMAAFFFASSLFGFVNGASTWDNVSVVGNTVVAGAAYAGAFWSLTVDVYGTGKESYDVANAVFAGNTLDAQYAYGGVVMDAGEGVGAYTNVSVHGNDVAVDSGSSLWRLDDELAVDLVNVDVSGNTFTATEGLGTGFSAVSDSYSFAYCNLTDLGTTPFTDVTDPSGTDGNVSVDPGYTDVSSSDPADWDLTLASGSALIDAGDPSITDTDGTASDIGAYGGPGAANW